MMFNGTALAATYRFIYGRLASSNFQEKKMDKKCVLAAVVVLSSLASGAACGQGYERQNELERGRQDQRGGENSQNDNPDYRRGEQGQLRDQHQPMDRNSYSGPQGDRRNDRGQMDERRRDDHANGQRRHDGEMGAGPRHDMRRGEHLSDEYRSRQYVVDDWRGHRLRQPPRGYHWVQAGSDYVLVAIGTGIIADILLNH
jgi:Ni/Co efflux regulator RcnB